MTIEHTIRKVEKDTGFLQTHVPQWILTLNLCLAVLYFYAMVFWFPKGNLYLWSILILSQFYHLYQVVTFIYTIWDTSHVHRGDRAYNPSVDVFITVAGEPLEIVEETIRGALRMDYPSFKVYVLNDGYVAKKDNWKEVELIAKQLGAECITRKIPGGAKAGNINNGMLETQSPFFVVFDADHVPHKSFLKETIQHFADPKVAFVQTPQFYKNFEYNYLTVGAWQQQLLFFGAICKGKNRLNSATMCGTNMAIRRAALQEVGGMCDTNIAEDFVTGLFLHERGWKSVYVPKVLARGLAPEDFLSYYKQQFRWARGSLEVIFKFNPLFKRGLTLAQKIQYIASSSYYLSGIIVVLNAFIPIVFFYTGMVPFLTATMTLAVVFIPYFFMVMYALQRSTNFSYAFKALSFSMASFPIHLRALWAVLTNEKSRFSITSKKQLDGNFLHLVAPHIVYILIAIVGIGVAVTREGISPSVVTNAAWAIFNIAVFVPFIKAASPSGVRVPRLEITKKKLALSNNLS